MTTPLTLPDLDVVRTWHLPASLRAVERKAPRAAPTPADDADGDTVDDPEADEEADASSDDLGLMDVRFSQFNTWYRIASFWEGDFMERTAPGAFKRTIDAHNAARSDDAHNIKTLFNHGMDFSIGDKILGSIDSLSEESDGPLSVVRLFDTSYNRDLLPGLRAGVYGSSFMFRVIQDEWNMEPGVSDYNPDGLPERTLKEVRTFEAGPVTFPASPTATAGMRCMSGTDAFYEHLTRLDPNRVGGMRSRLLALRSAGPAVGTPVEDELAADLPTDPASSHSDGLTPAQRRERLYPSLTGAVST